ncbi:MAG TPA: sugar ABC transporter permease, partial [Gemmatimonadales bacterium]|nr:sugar ABC transporter permease [Gemmatimonadales bacterium]
SSTDRWLVDARRLIVEAAARIPPPGVRVNVSDLAALVQDPEAELVPGEPAEAAPRRVQIDGAQRAVVAILIGSGRWVELRAVPAELKAPRWIVVVLPTALLGPLVILLLRWGERTPVRRRRETAIAWGFLTPTALHLLIFTLGPVLFTFYLAAHDGQAGISLANFRTVLDDPATEITIRNTFIYALYVPVSVLLALVAALLVDAHRHHWSGRLLGGAFLSSYVCSVVAIALIWQLLYQTGTRGLGRYDWLSNPATALAALMIVSVWAHIGGQMMVLLAGLRRIPRSYIDAARVDGAGVWRRFRRVTLPLLSPYLWLALVTGFISAVQVFTLVAVLTQGGPLPERSTEVLVHRIYELGWGSRGSQPAVGVASALALVVFVIVLILRWPQLRLLSRVSRHA